MTTPREDTLTKLTKEELTRMVRRYQRKADRYESLYRRCASEIWERDNPAPPEPWDQTTYIKSKIVEIESERKQLIEQRDKHKESNRILREQNKRLWQTIKTVTPEMKGTENAENDEGRNEKGND